MSILGVYGYEAGRPEGRAIELAVRGAADRVEWESVLRARSGEPSWVVCDQGKAIMAAVRRAWPGATVYACEAHLRMLGEKQLAADGHARFSALWKLLHPAVTSQHTWDTFEADARAAGATATLRWITKTRPLMQRQWRSRQKGRPRSIGGLESVFSELIRRLGDRRFVFRNHTRLELVLDLMALDLAREADEGLYREIIGSHLLAHDGVPRSRRGLDDRTGSSLHRLIRDAEQRLAKRREQNRRAARGHIERLKQAGVPRPTTPPRRPRRPRQGSAQ